MSMGEKLGGRRQFEQDSSRWSKRESEAASEQTAQIGRTIAERTAQMAVKAAFEAIEEHAVTRRDLKMAAGRVQNDDPALAQGLIKLSEAMNRVLEEDA